MKRLFNAFLALSMILMTIPSYVHAHGPKVENSHSTLVKSCKLLFAAAVTVGTLAAAVTYMSAAPAVSALPAVDCNLVAQAHCAGAQIPWPLLDRCQDQLQSAYWPTCLLKYYWLTK